MEMEAINTLPFLVALVTKRGQHYSQRFYTKFTHTGHYLHLKADHRLHVKGGVVHLVNQAKIMCQERHDFIEET
jgi:hypothetical protein